MGAYVEEVVIAGLDLAFIDSNPAWSVGAETDDQLAVSLPFLEVERQAGSGTTAPGIDSAIVDFYVYGPDRLTAGRFAEQARDAVIYRLPGFKGAGGVVSAVHWGGDGPHWIPYDNTNLRRFQFSAQIVIHTQP